MISLCKVQCIMGKTLSKEQCIVGKTLSKEQFIMGNNVHRVSLLVCNIEAALIILYSTRRTLRVPRP